MPNESEQKPGTRGTSPSSSSLGLGRRSPDESKRQPALWPTLAPDERPSSSLGETPPLARRVPESSSSSGLNFLGQRSPNESERQPAWPFFYARARQTSLRAAARAFFGPRSRSSLGFGQRSPGRVRGGAAWVCFGHRSSEEPQQSVWPGGPLREERDLTVNQYIYIYIYTSPRAEDWTRLSGEKKNRQAAARPRQARERRPKKSSRVCGERGRMARTGCRSDSSIERARLRTGCRSDPGRRSGCPQPAHLLGFVAGRAAGPILLKQYHLYNPRSIPSLAASAGGAKHGLRGGD